MAFKRCVSLRHIDLKSAIEIDFEGINCCENLESVVGDKLETIVGSAFVGCTSLKHLKLPSIITIKTSAFWGCKSLTDVELSERLQTIEMSAFNNCESLQRIAIPLKRGLFTIDYIRQRYTQFDGCEQLTTVDLVGEVHKTVASLHMESWRAEMITEINLINQVLPNTPAYYGRVSGINRINQVLPSTPADDKTAEIRRWMESLLDKMDHFKADHHRYVKAGTNLLELALWKAKLDEKEDNSVEGSKKKTVVDAESVRKEKRITCGADIVIKNVLPFLKLD